MSLAAAKINVTGTVQGVGFRYFCLIKARNLHLKGWVKNLPDRTVVTFVEGDKDSINTYFKFLQEGSPSSAVAHININWLSYTGKFDCFEITH